MESDDEMVVVIIGGGDEQELPIKEEPSEVPNDPFFVEQFIDTLEKHGENIEIDLTNEVSFEYETEYVDQEFLNTSEEGVFLRKRQKFYEDNSKQRHKMRKPSERKSLVDELRQSNPDYEEYPELLIEHLVWIMKSIKPPVLPEDYFYLNQNAMIACYKCDTESETVTAASRHYQEKHGSRYLICFACGVDFRSTTNLYKHEKCCAAPDAPYVLKARARCLGNKGRHRPYLPSKEQIVTIMRQYRNTKKTNEKYSCSDCRAVFLSASALQAHAYLHAGLRPHKCTQCPAAYTSQSALARHLSKHKNEKFICDYCGRTLKLKSALIAHMDTHKAMKKHGCDQCGKRYTQRAALLLHVRKQHLNLPPPFACQVCDRRFTRMYLLKIHMKEKHGMIIMTRKMFFKALPTMTDKQVLEKAKIIFKSSVSQPQIPEKNEDLSKEFMDTITDGKFEGEEVNSIEECEITGDLNPSEPKVYYRQNGNENQVVYYHENGEQYTNVDEKYYQIIEETETRDEMPVVKVECEEIQAYDKAVVIEAVNESVNNREIVIEISGTRD